MSRIRLDMPMAESIDCSPSTGGLRVVGQTTYDVQIRWRVVAVARADSLIAAYKAGDRVALNVAAFPVTVSGQIGEIHVTYAGHDKSRAEDLSVWIPNAELEVKA